MLYPTNFLTLIWGIKSLVGSTKQVTKQVNSDTKGLFLALKLPLYAVIEKSHKCYIVLDPLVSESLLGDWDK